MPTFFHEVLVDDGHAPRGPREVDDGEREALAVFFEDAVAPRPPARLGEKSPGPHRIVRGAATFLSKAGSEGLMGLLAMTP